MSKSKRIEELEEKIEHHNEAYYNGDAEVDNDVYDAWVDELRDLAPEHPLLNSVGISPDAQTKWQKKKHQMPMFSLNKVNQTDILQEWCGQLIKKLGGINPSSDIFSWSEKLDGISICLNYEQGDLVSAITRGDGQVGEDIIANVVLMQGVKRELDEKFTGSVRGEIVLTHDDYEDHFEEYSNPRNAASGIAKREKRADAKACQYLTVMAYDVVSDYEDFESEREKFLFLNSLDFKLPRHGFDKTPEELVQIYQMYGDRVRDELNYDIDGLVVKVQDTSDFDLLGIKGGNPLGAMAMKFASETAVTTLRNVRWQVGNTGRITPVAEFDTVSLVGADINRATLHNCTNIENLNVNIEDKILVERAGDVIPQVKKLVEEENEGHVNLPDSCPVCEGGLGWDGEFLICDNSTGCEAQTAGRIKMWINTLGLLDWGDFIVEQVVEKGIVTRISDLYRITYDQLVDIENENGAVLGEKRARNLIERLDNNRSITLDTFIGGLGVKLCRKRFAQMIIEAGYDTLESMRNVTKDELMGVEGVGPEKSEAFVEGIGSRSNLIDELLGYVKIESVGGTLEGLTFCLTGSMSKSRKEIKKDIENEGGRVKGMSKSVDYLVAGNPETTSSKAEKARSYGIPIISEEELEGLK